MRNLVGKPLTWMVLAEVVVVTALLLVAWNVVAAALTRHVPIAAPVSAARPPADPTPSLPSLPIIDRPQVRGPLPGLNLDSGFWRSRLGALNHDQVIFEQLEWRVIHVAMDAAQRYIETVVLPSVDRAEHASGGAFLKELA